MNKPEEGDMVHGRYTVRQAAKILDVSEETVRRYIRQRKLNATKVKSVGMKTAWAIDPKVLEAFTGSSRPSSGPSVTG